MLTFQKIRAMNLSRCNRWHGINDWSIMEWACAMMGEAGELGNVAKKIKRVETNIAKRSSEYTTNFNEKLAEEAADVFIYLDLICANRGIDLEAAVIAKFNKVSEEFNFPERLP